MERRGICIKVGEEKEMKKRGIVIFMLVTALAFAGCGKKASETLEEKESGKKTEQTSEEMSKLAEIPAPTATPKPTATPTPAVTKEQTELATRLREVYKDEVSARMVEKGYYYELDQVVEDENYLIEFKAVTGDMKNPKVVMDITVKDEILAKSYDEIKIFLHTLTETEFSDGGTHWPNDGYGKKDATQPDLFHVVANGNAYRMTNEETVVIDVCGINFEDIEYGDFEVEREIDTKEIRIQVPKYEFYPIPKREYTGCVFNHGGTEYLLDQAWCGQYVTELRFATYAGAEAVKEYSAGIAQYEALKQPEWKEFYSGLTLEVDGTEYRVERDGYHLSFSESDKQDGTFQGTGYVELSGVDYPEASEVILWAGTTGYDLKNVSSEPLTRELPASSKTEEPSLEQTEFAEYVRRLYKDEASASLIERGYYCMVDKTFEGEIFRFDLRAVTGDRHKRIMLFDIYVDDAGLAQNYDRICLRVGTTTEENYDADDDWAWNRVGYGYRDEEVGNLYHVAMEGSMFGHAPVVVDIYEVGFGLDTYKENQFLWYKVNPEPQIVETPMKTFCMTPEIQYSDGSLLITYEDRQYDLWRTSFGAYNTEIEFRTYFDAKEVPTDPHKLEKYRETVQDGWQKFSETLRLVADGVEYPIIVKEGTQSLLYFEVREGQESYRGNAALYFPAVDYDAASELLIKSGDTVHKLK